MPMVIRRCQFGCDGSSSCIAIVAHRARRWHGRRRSGFGRRSCPGSGRLTIEEDSDGCIDTQGRRRHGDRDGEHLAHTVTEMTRRGHQHGRRRWAAQAGSTDTVGRRTVDLLEPGAAGRWSSPPSCARAVVGWWYRRTRRSERRRLRRRGDRAGTARPPPAEPPPEADAVRPRHRQCPGWDSNPHCMDFEAIDSADWSTGAGRASVRTASAATGGRRYRRSAVYCRDDARVHFPGPGVAASGDGAAVARTRELGARR